MKKHHETAQNLRWLENTEAAEVAVMAKKNRRRKRGMKIFGGAAALVVFVTTYMMILPAITLSDTPTCGLEEHTHTASCYTEESILVCGQEESAGHTHTESCYDEAGNLICGQAESVGHTHTDACYTTDKILTCTIPEHVHSESCYPVEETTESAEETTAEESTDENEEEEELPVGDSDADVETAAAWEATFAGVELTGDWGADAIAIAKTQLGYCESTANFISYKDENGDVVKKGYSRYAAWYHNGESSYGDWCAMFCSFCYHYAEIPETYMPEHSGVPAWITLLNQRGQYHGAFSTDYVPKTGDLIFYDWEQDGTSDHVALVEKYEDGVVYTIEGNFNDSVVECHYNYGDYRIMGYGELPVNPDYHPEDEADGETEDAQGAGEAQEISDEQQSTVEKAEAVDDEQQSAVEDEQKNSDEQQSAAEEQKNSDEQQSAVEENQKNSDEQQSAEEENQKAADEQQSDSGSHRRISGEQEGASENDQPAVDEAQTISNDAEGKNEDTSDQAEEDSGLEASEEAQDEEGSAEEETEAEPEEAEPFTLTAKADDGMVIHLAGDVSALPYPAEEITVTAATVKNADVEELVESIADGDELPEYQAYTYDITLWHGDEEIEPTGPVTLTLEGIEVAEDAELHVFHTEDNTDDAQELATEVAEDGTISVETDGFSQYSVIIVYKNENEFELTAETEDGVKIKVTGPKSVLPDDIENITLTAERLEPSYTREYDENGELISVTEEESDYSKAADLSEQLLGSNVITDEDGNSQTYEWVHYIYDITLWDGDQEIEPDGNVILTIEGLPADPEEENHLLHIDDAQETVEELPAEYSEDGTITVETDHFSYYNKATNTFYITSADAWTTDNLNGRNVVVNKDITGISEAAKISDNTTIDLNGHTVSSTGRLLEVTGSTLTIKDSQKNSPTVSTVGGQNYDRTATYNASSKTLTYYVTESTANGDGTTTETVKQYTVTGAGLITSPSSNTGTSPIKLTDGTLTLESGMIAGCSNHPVYQAGGTLNLNGGYICGNSYSPENTDYGGGLKIEGGTCNLKGTVVAANSCTKRGGGIYITGATLNISGTGVVAGNKSGDNGGGIYATGSSTVKMDAGYITNNEMSFTKSDLSNYWSYRGGGICITGSSTLIVNNGYITGNYSSAGGGGIGSLQSSKSTKITINNGFISSNMAVNSEGGGIAVMSGTIANIYGGYITNNTMTTQRDWGGGGVFVAEGASCFIPRVVITKNTAGGYGGGMATCSTGAIYEDSNPELGGAIFNNTAAGTTLSGGSSSKHEDHTYGASSTVFTTNGYQDYFSAHASFISGVMFSGSQTPGLQNWSGSADGSPISSNGTTDYLTCTYIMGLTANPSAQDIQTAMSNAKVFITGNSSSTHGGGVLTNGYLYVGYPEEITVTEAMALTGTKKLLDENDKEQELEEGEFTFYIEDENENIISTGTNDASGNISFINAIPFKEAGTFIYYIYESGESDNGILNDTTRYRLTVTTEKTNTGTVTGNVTDSESITITKYKINFTKAVLESRNGDSGDWTEVRTVTSFTNSDTHTETFALTTDTTFTNHLSDNVSMSVQKVWADGTPGADSVTVYLKRNGESFTQSGIETTVQLSATNNWSYTWKDLPATGKAEDGSSVSFNYTVEEAQVAGYVSTVTYTNETSGSSGTYWVPVPSGEALTSGVDYAILNYDATKVLKVTSETKNSALTPGTNLVSISGKNTGSVTIGGKTYTNYFVGDVISDDSVFSYSEGKLVNKTYQTSYLRSGTNNALRTATSNSATAVQNNNGYFQFKYNSDWYYIYASSKYNQFYRTTSSSTSRLRLYKKITDNSKSLSTKAVITNTSTSTVSFRLNITKTNQPEPGQVPIVLRDAKFELRDDEENTVLKFTMGADGYYVYDEEGTVTTLVTDQNGFIGIKNMPGGTYTLHETQAPDGYDVAEDQTITLDESTPNATKEITVEDPIYTAKYALPETGGTGTHTFTLGGITLMLLALVIGFGTRRSREGRAVR